MEFCPPFDGWHLDVDGIIHTPSGYRCTPDQIESALWLRQGVLHDVAKRTIFADTPMIETRKFAESRDWIGERIDRLQIVAQRGICTRCGSKHQNRGLGAGNDS